MNETTFVLVHGAWHGPWAWDRLQAEFRDGETVTVALPSAGSDPSALGGGDDDVAAVETVIRAVDGPVVVVAHSNGGVSVTEAAGRLPNVVGVVYVAAWVLDIGETPLDMLNGDAPPSWWDVHAEEGYLDALRPEEIFYNDVDPATAAEYSARLVHQSLVAGTLTSVPAWRLIPTSYVLCELDAAIPPPAQDIMSARTGRIHRLESGHSPFISRPADLAAILRNDAAEFGNDAAEFAASAPRLSSGTTSREEP